MASRHVRKTNCSLPSHTSSMFWVRFILVGDASIGLVRDASVVTCFSSNTLDALSDDPSTEQELQLVAHACLCLL